MKSRTKVRSSMLHTSCRPIDIFCTQNCGGKVVVWLVGGNLRRSCVFVERGASLSYKITLERKTFGNKIGRENTLRYDDYVYFDTGLEFFITYILVMGEIERQKLINNVTGFAKKAWETIVKVTRFTVEALKAIVDLFVQDPLIPVILGKCMLPQAEETMSSSGMQLRASVFSWTSLQCDYFFIEIVSKGGFFLFSGCVGMIAGCAILPCCPPAGCVVFGIGAALTCGGTAACILNT